MAGFIPISTKELSSKFEFIKSENVGKLTNGGIWINLGGVDYQVFHEGKALMLTDNFLKAPRQAFPGGFEEILKALDESDTHDRLLMLVKAKHKM